MSSSPPSSSPRPHSETEKNPGERSRRSHSRRDKHSGSAARRSREQDMKLRTTLYPEGKALYRDPLPRHPRHETASVNRDAAHPHTKSRFSRFTREYGWRVYAIPVLAIITLWVLADILFGGYANKADPTTAASIRANEQSVASTASPEIGPDPAQLSPMASSLMDLPPGGSYSEHGDKTYRLVGAAGARAGEGRERTITYVVEVENGVNTAEYGGDDAFSALVDATLTNPKSWIADSRFAFEHVAPDAEPDLHIQLTSVDTTHERCGAELGMETSCFTTDGNRVVINESRWVRGATPFQGDLGGYRQYVINHEVGHGIGYASHVPCGAQGALAPIMMQQTISLNNKELHAIDPTEVYPDTDITCLPNSWPYPTGSTT